jgi:hypothetical protein
MGRIEMYCGGWSVKGEYEIPDRGDVGPDGVTALMKGVLDRGGLFRVKVDGRLVALGRDALSNCVVVLG